jgi:hypothetical protein
MRVERRGRVARAGSAVNQHGWEEPGERAEAAGQAVSDLQMGGLGGVSEGQGQPGRGRGGRAVDHRVRAGPQGEPVQALESAVVGQLLPATGEGRGDPQAGRQRGAGPRVPTVADRIAQTVVRRYLEPGVEPSFHPDSYGYRPGRSALDAVAACRERCWRTDWVIDLDIKAFFDSVPWDLVVKAVAHHTDQRWILLYVTRWLKAPLQQQDGTLVARDRGTPQGSAISPLLANLFLHYAFDAWMAREFPAISFERYCDDVVMHCASEQQARQVRDAIADRLAKLGLELHPDKTRIVYCKDADRRGEHAHTSFTFLGYTFRPRLAQKQARTSLRELPAGGQHRRGQGDEPGGPLLASRPAQ